MSSTRQRRNDTPIGRSLRPQVSGGKRYPFTYEARALVVFVLRSLGFDSVAINIGSINSRDIFWA
jgi:hypothetical protein